MNVVIASSCISCLSALYFLSVESCLLHKPVSDHSAQLCLQKKKTRPSFFSKGSATPDMTVGNPAESALSVLVSS